ncbi:MAG: DUF1015 domain-containing protein [Myxococcota bacterium]
MVAIRPFRGLRYDDTKVSGPLADVMAPPYDVVDAAGREALANKSPHNAIRFILPEGQGDAKYEAGAKTFRAMATEAMVQDERPAFYVYHQGFEVEGQRFVRKGFVTLVELTRFGQGPVLAHERTLAGPKVDRLNLMRACQAHLELVFGMFSDPGRRWEDALGDDLGDPVLDATIDGVQHTLWRVDDPSKVERLGLSLTDKNVYIADGHHRYETMVAYREELEAAGHRDAAFGMMYLSNLDDPGLVVLPTHRLVHGLAGVALPSVLEAVAPYFSVYEQEVPADAAGLRAALTPEEGRATLGLSLPGSGRMHVLRLNEDFEPAAAGLSTLPEALQRLDVVLLHELVLERALGITKEAQAAKTNLRYYKSTEASLAVAREGDADSQLVCLMNATPVRDVVAVCDSGEVMPQKSTFFYPKIPNGLVLYDLSPEGA